MFNECKKKPHPNGSEVQTIPKLIPYSSADGGCPKTFRKNRLGIPPGHRICRFPDCGSNPCQNGWCEETMQGYDCHCPVGFEGKHCDEKSSGTVDTNTISTSDLESRSTPVSTPDLTAASPSPAPTDATTTTPSDSTLAVTSPTSTSVPPTSTGSTIPNDATTITPSGSALPVNSPTSTSGPPTTTGSSSPTDESMITPSDSTLPVTSPTSTAGPPTTTAKVFVTDKGAGAIFISELHEGDKLNFMSIPSTSYPTYIKYDSVERYIYWSDWDERPVFRAKIDGRDREQVTAAGAYRPFGIAIAERSRILYIAYRWPNKVTSMSIERGSPLPGTETDFVNQGIFNPRALSIDEVEGYVYISQRHGIVRALLNTTNVIEEIYHNTDLHYLSGLSIDLTRNPRRIFLCDWEIKRTFYKDLSHVPGDDISSAVELTNYMQDPYQEAMMDVTYLNGTLYFVKQNNPKGIGIMTDYDQTNRSYIVQEISQFQDPQRILIIEP